ncbi:MAG: hypothetical protein AAB465_03410 [Patescibacteria group bacterium]
MRKFLIYLALEFAIVLLGFAALGNIPLILNGPGRYFSTPEIVVENYWQGVKSQNLLQQAISLKDIRLMDIYACAQQMMPSSVVVDSIRMVSSEPVTENIVKIKYRVFLASGKGKSFGSGDLVIFDPYFGWRILAPSN